MKANGCIDMSYAGGFQVILKKKYHNIIERQEL